MLKNLLFVSFLIFLGPSLFGQKNLLNKGKCTSKNYFEEIPFEMMNNKIVIKATIDSKEYRFLLDTGAPNVFSKSILKDISYTESKKMTILDANANKSRMQIIQVDEVKIGSISFKKIPAIAMDSSMIFDCFQIDGIIGSNLLRHTILKIEKDKNKVTFSDAIESMNLGDLTSQKMTLNKVQSNPFIQIELGTTDLKKSETVLFDTGMGDLFDLSTYSFESFQRDSLFLEYQIGFGSAGIGIHEKTDEVQLFRLNVPILSFQNKNLYNVTSITTESRESRIGAGILEYADVTMDYIHGAIYFDWKKDSINIAEKHFNMSPTLKDRKLIVGVIWSKELNGEVAIGDQIIRINDLVISTVDFCNFLIQESLFKNKNSIEIELLKADGTTVIVPLEKQRF